MLGGNILWNNSRYIKGSFDSCCTEMFSGFKVKVDPPTSDEQDPLYQNWIFLASEYWNM